MKKTGLEYLTKATYHKDMSTFGKFLLTLTVILSVLILGEIIYLNSFSQKGLETKNNSSLMQVDVPTPNPTLPIPASFQYFSEGVRSYLIPESKLEVTYLGTISEISASEPYILTIENGMEGVKKDDYKFKFLPDTFKKIEVVASGSSSQKKVTFANLRIGDKIEINAQYMLTRGASGVVTQSVESMKIEKK